MTPNGPGIRPALTWGRGHRGRLRDHSITEDNEQGRATGWLPGRLSPRGRELARELGSRRRDDGIAAVFSSDLRRAAEAASLAFLHASRCDHLDRPYPGGES
jgi:2,3-bisphosphoglycerate-dependent phosphoglycerate mutase